MHPIIVFNDLDQWFQSKFIEFYRIFKEATLLTPYLSIDQSFSHSIIHTLISSLDYKDAF